MLKFNNKLLPDFVKVKNITVDTLPTVTSNIRSIAGGYGSIAGISSFAEKRIIASVSVIIPKGETLQSCSRKLASWLKGDNFKLSPLIILDDEEVYYMAKPNTSATLNDLIFVGEGTLEFVVPSGVALSVDKVEHNGADRLVFDNEGTHTCFPTIEVILGQSVASGTILITHVTTGDRVILNGSFNAGDVLEINCDKHLVKVNGNVSMNMIGLNTKFFELEEGTNEIACAMASNLKVIFQNRYL